MQLCLQPAPKASMSSKVYIPNQNRMNQYAKLLYVHIHQIEMLEEEFDRVASFLLTMSHEEGTIRLFKACLLVRTTGRQWSSVYIIATLLA